METKRSGESFREQLLLRYIEKLLIQRKPIDCDEFELCLRLDSERSYHQGLYAEEAH